MIASRSIQQNSATKLRLAYKAAPIQGKSTLVAKLDQLIAGELSNSDLSISFLASALFMSERQLYRKVKQKTGKTPNEYIQECRLQKARQLLYSGQIEMLKEVSQQIGYKRTDYFSNLFEKRFGIRPAALLS